MNSNWALPTSISQYAEPGAEDHHVSWIDDNDFEGLKQVNDGSVKISRDLLHIAKQPNHDLVEKTYFLKLTGFNFNNLPDVVSGIEMRLTMKRYGRISDETVQLYLDNDAIGDNRASISLDPVNLYGSEDDNWNTNLSISDVQNPTFGLLVRFRSHPKWPHKSSALIDAVEIRIH